MTEKTYKTDRGFIHYWVEEHTEERLPTLVFLPGLTADSRLFEKQIAFFAPRANVLVWDAPAHASSFPFDLNFTLADKAKWLDGILCAEKMVKPVIVGQSMGGYVGQMYAQLFPEKAAGFVFIDSAPLQRKYMTAAELWLMKHTEGMYRAYPWKTLVRAGAKGCAETEYGRELMRSMMMTYNEDTERYIKLVSHGYKILARAVEDDLPYEIPCPVILICGEKDRAGSTKAYNKKWHKATNFPIYWIPNAGHNSNTDAPEEVNRIICAFLGKIIG